MRRYLPIMAFVSVAIASLAMSGFAYFAAQDAAHIKFEAAADEALNRIQSRLENNLSLLDASHALFSAQKGKVSRATFKTFFDAIDFDKNFIGLGGIGFASLVKHGDEAVAEKLIAGNYNKRIRIYPDSDQPWRAPIMLFEPINGTLGIGYDLFADIDRRAAMSGAMATDGEWATDEVVLGRPSSRLEIAGFFVFRRLLVDPAPSNDAMPPQSRISGLLFVTFKLKDFFNSVLNQQPVLPLAIEVLDATPPPGNRLFRSQSWNTQPDVPVTSRSTVVGGRKWTIMFQQTPAFEPPASREIPLILGSFGLLLAAAIALAVKLQSKAYAAAHALQLQAEKSLQEKDLMLQEMKHRIKNSITRMMAIARQSSKGVTDVKEFTDSFTARLQAMAAAQDMLTRARWQKADLLDLARIELTQAFGNELSDGVLEGPSLRLDEATTQALGLTLHELATNTLKYGNVSGLKVSWDVSGQGRNRKLRLRWEERGLTGVATPGKTGFGTRLINMSIERELGGTIHRQFAEDGLTVDIEIPLAPA